MKKGIITIFFVGILIASCGSDSSKSDSATAKVSAPAIEEVEKKVEEEKEPATGDMANKGIGPITSIELGEIDDALVKEGHEIFKLKCTACHKIGKKKIGPAMKGVVQRRSPEWIMNMILNPEEMTAKDPIAMKLLKEFSAPMANQSLKEEEARAILEYLRTKI